VPTLNEYTNEPGYYIRARPSSVGSPITYQIEPEAYSIIDAYGVVDGEQISWSVIQSLRSLGLVYTDQSGVLGSDEFEPDAEQLEETALDEAAARRLAEVIRTNLDIDAETFRTILDILNLDPSTFEFEETSSGFDIDFPTPKDYTSVPDFPVHDNIEVIDGKTIFKTNDWWKGAILASGYNSPDVLVYLWQKNGQSWKRKQKYKVAPDDWADEREIIDELVAQSS
jgi:hypothetical protein